MFFLVEFCWNQFDTYQNHFHCVNNHKPLMCAELRYSTTGPNLSTAHNPITNFYFRDSWANSFDEPCDWRAKDGGVFELKYCKFGGFSICWLDS
jgi:hypothetical protein